MNIERVCIRYCRIGNMEYLPGTKYQIELNPIDQQLRIYDAQTGMWELKIDGTRIMLDY